MLRLVGLGLLGNAVYQLLFITGVARTSAGNASLLLSTTPVWTALLSTAARHETLPPRVWQGIALAVVGMVFIVVGGEGLDLAGGTLAGDLLMVGAAVTWAAYTVGSHPMIRRYGAMQVTAWTLWAGTPVVVLMGIPWLGEIRRDALTPVTGVAVVYAGVLAVGVAYLLWNRGVRALGNARTAIYSNTVPIVALAAGWVLLGEVPTGLQLVGAAVILTGLSRSRGRRPPRPARAGSGEGPRETRRR